MDQQITSLFGGEPAAYEHVIKYLDSFPPTTRLAAYVRSARALVTLQQLKQSVS